MVDPGTLDGDRLIVATANRCVLPESSSARLAMDQPMNKAIAALAVTVGALVLGAGTAYADAPTPPPPPQTGLMAPIPLSVRARRPRFSMMLGSPAIVRLLSKLGSGT